MTFSSGLIDRPFTISLIYVFQSPLMFVEDNITGCVKRETNEIHFVSCTGKQSISIIHD